jgi:hypothetical protein
MMHDDADLAPILGEPHLPLRVGQGLRKIAEGACTLFEAIGERMSAFARRRTL